MVTIGPSVQASPATSFYLDAVVSAVVGNSSRVSVTVRANNGPGGTTGSQFNDTGYQRGSIDGVGTVVQHNGNPFLPAGVANGAQRWSQTGTVDIPHAANGTHANVTVRMNVVYGSVNVNLTATLALPRIPKVPSAPAAPTLQSVTTTDVTINFTGPPDNGGSAVTTFNHRISTDPTFATGVTTITDSTSPATFTGRPPGTQYIQTRAVNAVGAGPYSSTLTVSLLPSGPTGLSVVPALSGLTAWLYFAPPGGTSGVTEYQAERRDTGTTTPVVDYSSPSSPILISGLTPGKSYDWRARILIGSYVGAWSDWETVVQTNPNLDPGGYFDGAYAATSDLTFAFTGTANNSTSKAVGKRVQGWDAADAGGFAVVHRAQSGLVGTYAARVVMQGHDMPGAGLRIGQLADATSATEVAVGVQYVGSIIAQTHRVQRMAAEITFWNAAFGVVSRTVGPAVALVTNVPTRLTASAAAPPTAKWATVAAIDVTGTGFSVWLAGEAYSLDAADISIGVLYPYFDGDTLDTPEFSYKWTALANGSTSQRSPGSTSTIDPLADPDCVTMPDPPKPPTVPAECIDEVGVWRRYSVSIPAESVGLWTTTIPTMTLTTGAIGERQIRIRTYPNPDGLAPELVDKDSWDSEMIVSWIPPGTVLTLDGLTERAWASVGGGDEVAANRLLYGTGGVPATWPRMRCGSAYVVTFDGTLDTPAGNLNIDLALTEGA